MGIRLATACVLCAIESSAPERPPTMHNVDLGAFRPRSLEECDELIRARPADLFSYYCYQRVGLMDRAMTRPAIQRLESLAQRQPNNFRAKLYLGYLLWKLDRAPRAEQLVREAAQGFANAGEVTGEVYARTYLDSFLRLWGRGSEGTLEVQRASALAKASGDPLLVAYVKVFEGWHAIFELDYGRAGVLFSQAYAVARTGRNSWLLAEVLEAQGSYFRAVGRLHEAVDADRTRVTLLRDNIISQSEARSRLALYASELSENGDLSAADADRLVEVALSGAKRAGAEVPWTRALYLHAQRHPDRNRAIAEMEEVLQRSREYGDSFYVICALRYLSMWNVDVDPAHSQVALHQAVEATALSEASGLGYAEQCAYGRMAQAYVLWKTGERSAAVRELHRVLDLVDGFRDLQPDEVVRAGTMAQWTSAYVNALRPVLDQELATPEDLRLAFSLIERVRARTLLDHLRATGAIPPLTPEVRDRRAAILQQLAGIQRTLLGRGLTEGARAEAVTELQRVESEEQELREKIALSNPGLRGSGAGEVASLDDIQRTLAEDQALLTYQSWTNVHGQRDGLWVLAVTRDSVHPARLELPEGIDEMLDIFSALADLRNDSERPGSVRLYQVLVEASLSQLPNTVRSLVVVPDGPLHRLPFEALRQSADAPTLGERFRVSVVPSATLWLRWRKMGQVSQRASVLAVASSAVAGGTAGFSQRSDQLLRPLEFAREEATQAVRSFGGSSRLLFGADASEAGLKAADLRQFGVIHFAAHALVDGDHPERSGVVLSPGSSAEDGLLQARDVVELDLRDRVVVLASCRGSAGRALRGEGVMSLARSFFQAGARTVVASAWPLRDDESALLFAEFYRRLADGVSVEQALADARRQRIHAGAPTAAWAGLTVLGDGSAVPGRAGRQLFASAFFVAGAAALVLALVLVVLVRGHRSGRH